MNVKFISVAVLSIIIVVGLALYATQKTAEQVDNKELVKIQAVVEGFGLRLRNVSLLAPEETVRADIEHEYGPYVDEKLITAWQLAPLDAPGRLTSSPWPARINIETITKINSSKYSVQGTMIELSSAEETSGSIAASYPVTLTVEKIDGAWLITTYEKGALIRNVTAPTQ